ncbi:MAG TPA: zf-HC2 domain-containing protein [Acidobacteriota bacterium]|nr:zf-HC2 domain-containing protein [Acidobacteriota bacterium]
MNCKGIEQQMMDVLYGEALDSRECFAFFRHLQECSECRREYDELVETRRALSEWQVDDLPDGTLKPLIREWETESPSARPAASVSYWTWMQRAAAVFLMALGLWTLLAQAGLTPAWARPTGPVLSEAELEQIVQEKASRMVADEVYSMKAHFQGLLERFQNELRYVEQNSDKQSRELLEVMQGQRERSSSGT